MKAEEKRKRWNKFITALERCSESNRDCGGCKTKESCMSAVVIMAGKCGSIGIAERKRGKHYQKVSMGNPCVEGCALVGYRVRPLAIEHVHGCSMLGDGSWRPKSGNEHQRPHLER